MKIIQTYEGAETIISKGKPIGKGLIKVDEWDDLSVIKRISEIEFEGSFKELDDMIEQIKEKVEGKNLRIYNHSGNLQTSEIMGSLKLNFKTGEVYFLDIVSDKFVVSKLIKEDLDKREWRIRIIQNSLTPMMASIFLKFAEIDSDFVNPFCKDGTLGIEASLKNGKNIVMTDDRFHNVKFAKENAFLANQEIEILESNLDILNGIGKKNLIASYSPFNRNNEMRKYQYLSKYFNLFDKIAIICIKEIDDFLKKELEFNKLDKKIVKKQKIMQGDMPFYLYLII